MKSPFPLAVHSLTRFWWDAADYLASVAQKRLGLWPVPAKPFLPPPTATARVEPDTAKPTSRAGTAHASEPARPSTRRAIPRFRLIEATKATPATPPRARFRTGPRIRFLDEETPVDLRDYPASPTDILPAGKLVRRLMAVNHALDHAAEYVARMRQIMVSAGPVLKRAVPPVFKTRKLRHLQQDSACQLHAATWDFLSPDTS